MPAPGPEHAKLAALTGQWIGDETMFPSPMCPEETKSQGSLQGRMLDDFFVISDYEQKVDGQISFRGHGVYSYDPAKKHYVMYWFDSMGGAGGVATGQFEGHQLTFENTSPVGQHRYRYTFHEDETVFEMSMSPDGTNWQAMMEAHYRRA